MPLEPETWGMFASSGATPDDEAELGELLQAVQGGIAEALTPHQRKSWSRSRWNGDPIDVLAERGSDRPAAPSTRTLHVARAKLRTHLGDLLEVIE